MAVVVLAGNERLPRGVAQSASQAEEGFTSGFTDGEMGIIGTPGESTQSYCLQTGRSDGRYCAVNFRPAMDGPRGGGLGTCVGVMPPCGAAESAGREGDLTARLRATATATAPARHSQPCANGLPPPCSGPPHHPSNNACHAMQAYNTGSTRGEVEEMIQASHMSQADCVASQDYDGSPYCAVNFYPDADSDSYIPDGECKGVRPPCGDTVGETPGSFTATLPIDKSGTCTWRREPASASSDAVASPARPSQPSISTQTGTATGHSPAPRVVSHVQEQQSASYSCDDATISRLFADINDICCAGQDCSNAPPPLCNQQCHDVIMDAWNNADCQRVLLPMMGDNIVAFVRLCKETHAAAGDESPSVFNADAAAGVEPSSVSNSGTTGENSMACSYSQMVSVAQQCSVADEQDCRSGCIMQLNAFLGKCSAMLTGTFPSLQPTVAAFQSMVSRCNGGH